jgi:hypothetical protein
MTQPEPGEVQRPWRAFLSSASGEFLESYRKAAAEVVGEFPDFELVQMEDWGPATRRLASTASTRFSAVISCSGSSGIGTAAIHAMTRVHSRRSNTTRPVVGTSASCSTSSTSSRLTNTREKRMRPTNSACATKCSRTGSAPSG